MRLRKIVKYLNRSAVLAPFVAIALGLTLANAARATPPDKEPTVTNNVPIAAAVAGARATAVQRLQAQQTVNVSVNEGGSGSSKGQLPAVASSNATGGNGYGGAGGSVVMSETAASAYSAALTSANGTCMGSSSGGAQGASFGVSFGTTWKDGDCSKRYNAEALKAMGLFKQAHALLCGIEDVKAVDPRGCDAVARELGTLAQSTVMPVTVSASSEITDPYVKARLERQGK